jgi:uncharacterized membrane protein YvbJ
MKQQAGRSTKKTIESQKVPLRKDKLFQRKIILLAIILLLFILLILDKELGLFVKIFGDRNIQFKLPW